MALLNYVFVDFSPELIPPALVPAPSAAAAAVSVVSGWLKRLVLAAHRSRNPHSPPRLLLSPLYRQQQQQPN